MKILNRKNMFVIISVLLVLTLLGTTIVPESAKAAGDSRSELINKFSKKSRYKFKVMDGKSQYDAFIYSDKEKKAVNDIGWACAREGDSYYTGNYNIAVIKQGSTKVQTTQIGEQSFDAKTSYNFAYAVKGKPDLIAIARCEASSGASVDLYTMVNEKMAGLKKGIFTINGVNIKAAGDQTFQSVYFNNAEDWGYYFETWVLDKAKLTIRLKKTFHSADGGGNIYKKWLKEPKYIVTK
ncbi:hypothetical protein J2T13_002196 [Paenibacillus sp. DS2015]|uniref:hypothetical protein n=1 Tax=Paenibacillus sp. DS2015 TaxID=3373917 RepID=UPI003D1A3148